MPHDPIEYPVVVNTGASLVGQTDEVAVLMIEVFDQCLTPPDWHVIRYKTGISKILTLVIVF